MSTSRWMDNEQRVVFVFCCCEKTLARSTLERKRVISTNSPGQELKGTRRKKTKFSFPAFMISKKSTSKFPRGWSPIAIVTQMFQLLPLTLSLKVPSPVTIPPRAVFQGKQQFATLLASGSFTPAFGFNRLIIVWAISSVKFPGLFSEIGWVLKQLSHSDKFIHILSFLR